MDAESSSPTYSPPPSLRHKLRTTVCGCFGSPDSGGDGQRARWRRREATTGEFRYDPLSYALNFDEGSDENGDEAETSRRRNFSSRLPPSPKPAAARRLTAVSIA